MATPRSRYSDRCSQIIRQWRLRVVDDACIHGNRLEACSWCDLRDDGGLPEAQTPVVTQEGE
jgi:hypothetical protein